jgi:presenilin-like A22 family membrane protease
MSKPPSSAPERQEEIPAAARAARLVFASALEIFLLGSVLLLVLLVGRLAAFAKPGTVAAAAAPELTIWSFITAFAAATALLVILARTRRGALVFTLLFTLAVFVGVGAWFETAFGTGPAIIAVAAAVLLHYAVSRVATYDLILVFGMAGLALGLGEAMRPLVVVVILAGLSFYDLFAVYVTRHLAEAAASLLRQRAIFAIIIPSTSAGFFKRLKEVSADGGFFFLGTGDMVLPAMLVASLAVRGSSAAVPVAIGALAGLLATSLIFAAQRTHRPMPALPPIALGSIVGYLITLLAS